MTGKPTDPRSMNRFLYAEANPWTLVDPSGHMAGCASASSDLCNETTAVKYKNTPAGKTAKKKVSDHDHPCQGMSGADLAACRAPYSAPTPKAQSTPTCSSSICNASAPTTAVETDWSTWANAKIDWSTVGQSVCTAADPCVPQVECATALFGGPCLLTPFTNPVSAYECDSECQAEGFRLAIVLTVVTVGTYGCASVCPALLFGAAESAGAMKDRLKDLVQGSSIPGYGAPWSQLPKVIQAGKQYAQMGQYLFSKHAVDRMLPAGFGGRSIPPSVVVSAIQSAKPVVDDLVEGIQRFSYTYGGVTVIYEPATNVVVSVWGGQ